jgi:hypothetical protein
VARHASRKDLPLEIALLRAAVMHNSQLQRNRPAVLTPGYGEDVRITRETVSVQALSREDSQISKSGRPLHRSAPNSVNPPFVRLGTRPTCDRRQSSLTHSSPSPHTRSLTA